MPSIQERDYYQRRADQERAAAAKATIKANTMVANLHLELAARYAQLSQPDAVPRQDAVAE